MTKDTLCCEAFFPWEFCSPSNPGAVPFFTCLRARWTELLNSKHWESKVSDFKLKIPAENILMAKAGLVFFTTKYFRTNVASEKWQTATWTAESISHGRNAAAASCLLLIGVWVGWQHFCVSSAASMLLVSPQEPQDKQHSAPQAVHTHTHRAGTKQVPWSAKRRGQSAWLTSALLSSWQQTLAPPVQGFGGEVPPQGKKM